MPFGQVASRSIPAAPCTEAPVCGSTRSLTRDTNVACRLSAADEDRMRPRSRACRWCASTTIHLAADGLQTPKDLRHRGDRDPVDLHALPGRAVECAAAVLTRNPGQHVGLFGCEDALRPCAGSRSSRQPFIAGS